MSRRRLSSLDEVASAYSTRSGFDGALMAEKKGRGMVKADAEDVRTRPAMRIGVDSIILVATKIIPTRRL